MYVALFPISVEIDGADVIQDWSEDGEKMDEYIDDDVVVEGHLLSRNCHLHNIHASPYS